MLLVDVLSSWVRQRILKRDFRLKQLMYVVALLASLLWVAHAVVLWSCVGLVPNIAAVMDLMTVALYGAVGSYHSRPLLLNLVVPQLATLCVLLVSYLAAHESPFAAVMATLATIGACGTILMNGLLMHEGELKLRRSNADMARLNAELANLAETAQVASAAKSSFLANVSHEIRTPLNGVLGMAQAMTTGALTEEQRSRLKVIKESGEALLALLNDILDIAKIEAGRIEVEDVEFDVGRLVVSATAPFQALADAKGVSLIIDVSPLAEGICRGDPTRLRQILANLVSNAVKFTEKGHVRVTVGREDRLLVASVADTGIGIPQTSLEAMFQPFSQVDASTTRRHGGTGLGLSISKQLAGLMGGAITVKSEPGLGSTFTVSLPIARVRALADAGDVSQDAAGQDPWGWRERGDPAQSPLCRLRILAAEDHEANRLVLQALLQASGAHLTVVGNGEEAIAAFRSGVWDLILMDVQMPVMDGLEATRRIRAYECASAVTPTPILALTANAMPDQIAHYIHSGFSGHIAKPIDIAALYAALEATLGTASSGEEARRRA